MRYSLEEYQKGMMALIKERPSALPDHFTNQVKDSVGLRMIHEVVLSWRRLHLESRWPITSAYVNRFGLLDKMIKEVYQNTSISSYIEEVAQQFSVKWSRSDDKMLRLVHLFERSLVDIRKGEFVDEILIWPMDPRQCLYSVMHVQPFVTTESTTYFMRISSAMTNTYEIIEMN